MTRTTSYSLRSLMLLMLAALAACVLMAVVIAVPARAATFTVNTAADEQNTNGEWCSLREAIITANQNDQSGSTDCPAGVGQDTIDFDPSLLGQTITLGSQLPAITDSAGLTIDGGGANITISGNRGTSMINGVRVFQVDSSGKLTLDGLTVTNGNADVGGGISNAGALTVRNFTISDHLAINAGGIYNQGTMTVSNSTIANN
jgi:CSLREA domain-containing protein